MRRVFAVVVVIACVAGAVVGARWYLPYYRHVTVSAQASPSPTPTSEASGDTAQARAEAGVGGSPGASASGSGAARNGTALPPASPTPNPDHAPADAIFDDEFNGPAGSSPSGLWHHNTGFGWDNGATRQTYTTSPRNSALDGDGHLVLTARADPSVQGGHTSARLQSWAAPFRSGTDIQIRAKTSGFEPGAWPAAWTLGEPESEWPRTGEVDVFEDWGSGADRADFTPQFREHTSVSRAGTVYAGMTATRWHVYEVRWSGSTLTFLVDGVAVDQEPYAPTAASTIVLNIAVGSLGGTPATPWHDFSMSIDYVRVLPL